jgi:hypothetical protein
MIDEEASRAAWKDLEACGDDPDGDTSWVDALPEGRPDDADSVTAIFITLPEKEEQ